MSEASEICPSGACSGPGAWRVAFISFAVLTLELALIRQMPAEVKAVSYFTNLVLMASFFGLGLGCVLQRKRSLDWLLVAGLLLVLGFILFGRGVALFSEAQGVHYWLAAGTIPSQARRLPLLPTALAAFLCAATPFVALGQRLALEMERHSRLVAYSWDIAGSLSGTVVFTASAAAGVPPWVWIIVVLSVWAAIFPRTPLSRALHVMSGLAFLTCAQSPLLWQWSPYYFIQTQPVPSGLLVFVNSSFHQQAIDFTASGAAERSLQEHLRTKWGRPYVLYRELHDGRPPADVLVLGAGTGNDVVMALENGASRVVAVEIDPQILELGRTRNPCRPYQDPRVRAVVDDARHFLRSTREQYDLIVFGTLDSQALLSGYANLRLENYVYTRESLLDARSRLADRGVVVVFYSVFRPWLWNRLYATLRAAFGEESFLYIEPTNMLFNTQLVGVKDVPGFHSDPAMVARFGDGAIATDDWPFIYLEQRTIAPIYRQVLAFIAVLVLSAFLLVGRVHRSEAPKLHFLLLGLGFTLMESSAVVRMALLFGATWIVNAVVFAAALATIFLANLTVLKGRAISLNLAWMGLLAGIILNYVFPVSALAALPGTLRALAAAILIGWPVLCASTCFSHLFRHEAVTGYALGVNLIGAMGGGLLEYASMLTGMRAVWLVALVVYAAAWFTSRLQSARA